MAEQQDKRGDTTREALLESATRVFAEYGLHGVSTRTLAAEANVNLALIGYHFGGKEGLYHAVFENIVDQMESQMQSRIEEVSQILESVPKTLSANARQETYLPVLLGICNGMSEMMLRPETKYWAQLFGREHNQPTAVFDLIYERFMKRIIQVLTRLVSVIRDEQDETVVRTISIGILSQLIIWRMAREGVLRIMGWKEIEEKELVIAQQAIARNVTALVNG